MKTKNLVPAIIITLLVGCDTQAPDSTKPEVFVFGSSMGSVQEKLADECDSLIVHLNEPIQLPTVRNSQSQLDCYGFKYAGKKRKAELIFADDELDIIWILTRPEEEKLFVDEFTKHFGAPTHTRSDVTFWLENGVAVRNDPHEVLFISDRLKAPYEQFLNQQ